MGRLDGKVAFITGVARGQGRSHAVRLAQEGADIIGIDVCADVESVPIPLATDEDLKETIGLVEALDRRIVATKADVRDFEAVKASLDAGVAALGRLDIVCANAGVVSFGQAADLSETTWQDTIDINLTGAWHTAKAAIPHLVAGGRGGSIILVSSGAGLRGVPNISHYVSSKHGLVGLMRSLALELGPHEIRVNTVHPGNIDTPMFMSDAVRALYCPGIDNPTETDLEAVAITQSVLPVRWLEAVDVSNAVLFLASDEARFITSVSLPVDAGFVVK